PALRQLADTPVVQSDHSRGGDTRDESLNLDTGVLTEPDDDIVHRRGAANQPREDSTHESGDSRANRTDNLVVVGHACSLEEGARGGFGTRTLVARTDRDNDHRLRPGISILVVSATEPHLRNCSKIRGAL